MPTELIDPAPAAPETELLLAFLNLQRDKLRRKTEELLSDQLSTALAPSTMTLGGLLKHLALVESHWLDATFLGNQLMAPFDTVDWEADGDWEWHSASSDSPEELRALFDESVRRSDATIAAAAQGLDTLSARPSRRTDTPFSLRWIVVHLIEEYAQHLGHADLIRESIDGQVGE